MATLLESLTVSVVTAVVTASAGYYFFLKKYRFQKEYERKLATYENILNTFYRAFVTEADDTAIKRFVEAHHTAWLDASPDVLKAVNRITIDTTKEGVSKEQIKGGIRDVIDAMREDLGNDVEELEEVNYFIFALDDGTPIPLEKRI